jgi:hypothetical protein
MFMKFIMRNKSLANSCCQVEQLENFYTVFVSVGIPFSNCNAAALTTGAAENLRNRRLTTHLDMRQGQNVIPLKFRDPGWPITVPYRKSSGRSGDKTVNYCKLITVN